MVVKAPLRVFRLVFAGVKQTVTAELRVVQHRPSVGADLVIPVHDHALPGQIDRVVIVILFDFHGVAAETALVLRILRFQILRIHKIYNEQVLALLDVGDPRLPEDLQQVDPDDVDVAESVLLLIVPENAVDRSAVLQLVPRGVAVGLVEVVVLHDHGEDLT